MDIMMPKIRPNQELVKALEVMLAKARAGLIQDGMMVGVGYDSANRQEWYHHYSIERPDDVLIMIGELELFQDVLKASVHNARNRAAGIAKVKGIPA